MFSSVSYKHPKYQTPLRFLSSQLRARRIVDARVVNPPRKRKRGKVTDLFLRIPNLTFIHRSLAGLSFVIYNEISKMNKSLDDRWQQWYRIKIEYMISHLILYF